MTKRIVIVGGGFAGLYCARALRRAPVEITLIDRRNHHLFQPMLYQVASAALAPNDIASPIRSIFSRQPNTQVLLAEAARVDLAARQVALVDGSVVPYDALVLAPGTRHHYFGRDAEWEPLAPGLKSIEDAETIRRRVLLAFEAAEREPDPVQRHAYLTFVVVGGGPTGIELAGALAEIRKYALAKDFRHIDPREAVVMLLEASPRVLSSYPEHLGQRAKEDLRRLGVEVRVEAFVSDIRPGCVVAAGWTIPTHNVVWAAGNVASPLLQTLGTPLDSQGRAIVEPDCSLPGHPEVFVLGDAACFTHGRTDGSPVPALCPGAIQMGKFAAAALKADLAGKPRGEFRYFDKGQLAVIGRGRAVADIWKFEFGGLIAWLLWIFIHIAFLIGFRNRAVVLTEWAVSYFTYKRGARLITDEEPLGNPEQALLSE
ncbi:MAG TPA: NAD(P)/FAD-dependent oxidoreductase [Gemmatimonadales bacterium]|nr:NAD(P)/FAD-dependent oxidoreductase [Gemmatimonadales bacterium]